MKKPICKLCRVRHLGDCPMLVRLKSGPPADKRKTLKAKQPWLDADVSVTWFRRKKQLMQQQESEK
jgi:hypothetical protein